MIYANKLANVRHDIIKTKRLEEAVLQQLQNNIRKKAEKQHISSSSNTADDDIQDVYMHHQPIANDPLDTEASNQTNTKDSAASNEINTMSEKVMIKL